MDAVLRVSGEDLDLEACLKSLPTERLQAVWRKGEESLIGRVRRTSGFNFLLSDASDVSRLEEELVLSLRQLEETLFPVLGKDACVEVDFAVFVTESGMGSLSLRSDTLRVLSQYGISLVVSAYPTSFEGDENET